MFIYLNTTFELRENNEKIFIKTYFTELEEHLRLNGFEDKIDEFDSSIRRI